MRRALLAACGVALVAGLAGVAGVRAYLAAPLAIPAAGYRLDVRPGDSLGGIARRLAADGVAAWPQLLVAWGRWSGQAQRIQAGEYDLAPGLTPVTLLDHLVSGEVVLHQVTLVEGRTVREILATLRDTPALEATLRADDAVTLATELGLPYDSAEGWFFPDTYRFPRGTPDRDVLRQAQAAMAERLAAAWSNRAPDSPLQSPYELLVLASIVERETALAAERPQVAGVFARRLAIGMRLQADPTVIYGLGTAFDGNITRADLQRDNAFNTYTRTGLPPTPIGAPGAGALEAAANPAAGDALYFVATGRGDGSHRFSATLAEHDRAVREFVAATSN